MTPTPLATGRATGTTRNAQRVDYEVTHTTTARKEREENFTANDATGTTTQILLVQDVTPAPPGSRTKVKAIIHHGQSTTQSQQQNQITITMATTPQDRHQHHPVLEALLTSRSSS